MSFRAKTDPRSEPSRRVPRPAAGSGAHPSDTVNEGTADRLFDPDAVRAADHATAENLLRCRVRESGTPLPPTGGLLRLPLPATGTIVVAEVRHHSVTGFHRFGPVRLSTGVSLDATTLAALLALESAHGRTGTSVAVAELTARVVDSTRRTTRAIVVRRGAQRDPGGTTPFLAAEQALLLGHPFHPVAGSRVGMDGIEAERFFPELRGSFALHWFAAEPDVVSWDADLGTPLPDVLASLGGAAGAPDGMVVFPAHPWQARNVVARPGLRELLDAGRLLDLGPSGPGWSATSSVRTVYRAKAPVMLKTSLGVEITNSRRENTLPQLRRGLAVHRMLDAGLKRALHTAYPGFDVIRDLGWLSVRLPGRERAESGLELVVRDNPLGGADDDVVCVAGLVAPRPDLPDGRSRLADLVAGYATATGTAPATAAEEWFTRYLECAIAPLLWMYEEYGLALEAHLQNTLVVLGEDGRPIGGRYRDSKGCFFSAERGGALARWLPGGGRDLGTWCPDAVLDERVGYYLVVNNVMGVIGAMGAQGLADERALLARARALLDSFRQERAKRGGTGRTRALSGRLLEAPVLRCKANLLTRVAGMDELARRPELQSVYVDIPNPLAEDST